MRWRGLRIGTAAFALAAIGACRDAAVPTEAAAPKPPARPRIALVMKTLTSPFFVEMEKGARRAEGELGIELVVKTAAQETSIEQQVAIIDQLTRERVDAIVVAPGDSYRLIPGLRKAQDAGIAVVVVDNRLDAAIATKEGLVGVPFVGVDNRRAFYESTKHLVADLKAPTQAALIEGIRSAANAQERKAGALQAIGENPHVKVVAAEPANWKIDDAYEVARKLFAAHPRIRVLVCANDMMALGAIRYLQEARIRGVRVSGYDALEEARQAIREGWLTVSVDQQSGMQGYTGVAYAVRMLKGDKPPAETLLETRLVAAADPARAGK